MAEKRCSACNQMVPLEWFNVNRARKDGLSERCKTCTRTAHRARYRAERERILASQNQRRTADIEATKAAAQAYRDANRERVKAWNFRASLKRYGINEAIYAAMLAEQEGRCAVCRKDGPLDIDHNHTTGNVRGLLCRRCNLLVAYLEPNPSAAHVALDYLERDRSWTPE